MNWAKLSSARVQKLDVASYRVPGQVPLRENWADVSEAPQLLNLMFIRRCLVHPHWANVHFGVLVLLGRKEERNVIQQSQSYLNWQEVCAVGLEVDFPVRLQMRVTRLPPDEICVGLGLGCFLFSLLKT